MEDGIAAAVIVLCILVAADIIIRLVKNKDSKDVIEEEIISMVNEGHEQGLLETSEATMINNIFDFADKEVGDIMTNRSNVVAFDASIKLGDAIKQMLNNSYSRYPVYEDNLDHVNGILYLKDAMRFFNKDESLENRAISDINGLVRKAMFTTETLNIDDLFKTMQSKKTQLAIVVDEYGQTVGIVTMEDILEEIVGNIMDEYDVEEKHIKKRGADSYVIDGMTALAEIEEIFKIKFEIEEFETLNGFLISKLDRLPVQGDALTVNVGGYDFSILEVKNRMISKVLVKKETNMKEEETN